MSVMKTRKRIQQDSPAAESFRKTPTKGKLGTYSVLALVCWLIAIWTYLSGGVRIVALIPLVVGIVCAAVAYDTWRRLRS